MAGLSAAFLLCAKSFRREISEECARERGRAEKQTITSTLTSRAPFVTMFRRCNVVALGSRINSRIAFVFEKPSRWDVKCDILVGRKLFCGTERLMKILSKLIWTVADDNTNRNILRIWICLSIHVINEELLYRSYYTDLIIQMTKNIIWILAIMYNMIENIGFIKRWFAIIYSRIR